MSMDLALTSSTVSGPPADRCQWFLVCSKIITAHCHGNRHIMSRTQTHLLDSIPLHVTLQIRDSCSVVLTTPISKVFHFIICCCIVVDIRLCCHYDDVIMTTIASQITSLTVVYSTVYSDADQSKHQKLRVTGLCVGNSPGPVNSPHKGPVTRKMFPFDDVIML